MSDIVERLRGRMTKAELKAAFSLPSIDMKEEAALEIDSLRSQLSAMRADAERYRWLIEERCYYTPPRDVDIYLVAKGDVADAIDRDWRAITHAAIDTAMGNPDHSGKSS